MRIGTASSDLAGGRGRPISWYRPWATVVSPTPRVAASSNEMLSAILSWIPTLALMCSAKDPLAWSAGSPEKY